MVFGLSVFLCRGVYVLYIRAIGKNGIFGGYCEGKFMHQRCLVPIILAGFLLVLVVVF